MAGGRRATCHSVFMLTPICSCHAAERRLDCANSCNSLLSAATLAPQARRRPNSVGSLWRANNVSIAGVCSRRVCCDDERAQARKSLRRRRDLRAPSAHSAQPKERLALPIARRLLCQFDCRRASRLSAVAQTANDIVRLDRCRRRRASRSVAGLCAGAWRAQLVHSDKLEQSADWHEFGAEFAAAAAPQTRASKRMSKSGGGTRCRSASKIGVPLSELVASLPLRRRRHFWLSPPPPPPTDRHNALSCRSFV